MKPDTLKRVVELQLRGGAGGGRQQPQQRAPPRPAPVRARRARLDGRARRRVERDANLGARKERPVGVPLAQLLARGLVLAYAIASRDAGAQLVVDAGDVVTEEGDVLAAAQPGRLPRPPVVLQRTAEAAAGEAEAEEGRLVPFRREVSLSIRMVKVSVPLVMSTFADPEAGHCVASARVNPTNWINSLSVDSSNAVTTAGAGNVFPLFAR